MATTKPGFRLPVFSTNPVEMARQVTEWARQVIGGKINVTLDVTLDANAASTTINDARIGYYTAIIPAMPMTAHAAAELGNGTLYIAQGTITKGQAVITHANNAQADRLIRFVFLG